MSQHLRKVVIALACFGALTAGGSPASALNVEQRKCLEAVAKEGAKLAAALLKTHAGYSDRQLEDGGGDVPKREAKIAQASSKLRAKVDKRCGPARLPIPFAGLRAIGFPGKCSDATPATLFDEHDLGACLAGTHGAIAQRLFELEYGDHGATGASPLPAMPAQTGKCQREIGTRGRGFVKAVLKEIQKCRNALNQGKLAGFLPRACGDQAPFREKIDRAASKVVARIVAICTGEQIQTLDVCDTCDPGDCPAMTPEEAAQCIVATHRNATDDPDDSGLATPFPTDLVDVEYALGAICGDGIVNDPLASGVTGRHVAAESPEECDRTADAACPGLCGDPTGGFGCLCTDVPRQRIVEHANADLDVGWKGQSHDSRIVEGGGYVVDLYDCDGTTAMGGTDPLCTVGPSCQDPPHQPCRHDGQCPGAGNFCRKRATAVGPHCSDDVQRICTSDADCEGEAFCRTTAHGAPLPLVAGSVSVCVENVFSEDVTGTANLDDGSFALRIRQDAVTRLTAGLVNQPCPSCGHFCDAPAFPGSPGGRILCELDADCFGVPYPGQPGRCVTDAICSFGENIDKPCRRTPPFGSPTPLFGIPSVDCPRERTSAPLAVPDILFAPATSGTVTRKPEHQCDAPGFVGRACIAGVSVGAPCATDGECVGGGVGSCAHQCFCPPGGGQPEQPNDCLAACRGGVNDMLSCAVDGECPGGFCQQASCRENPADTDSAQEGFCPGGPFPARCSHTVIHGCLADADCRRPTCGICEADDSETCVAAPLECFVNEGIVRGGSPGVPDAVAAATFCIPSTGGSAVDTTAGLPGPGALTQPITTDTTGVLD